MFENGRKTIGVILCDVSLSGTNLPDVVDVCKRGRL